MWRGRSSNTQHGALGEARGAGASWRVLGTELSVARARCTKMNTVFAAAGRGTPKACGKGSEILSKQPHWS